MFLGITLHDDLENLLPGASVPGNEPNINFTRYHSKNILDTLLDLK